MEEIAASTQAATQAVSVTLVAFFEFMVKYALKLPVSEKSLVSEITGELMRACKSNFRVITYAKGGMRHRQ